MPIGFVVVTWRRCGANARTYGLSTRVESPVTSERRGRHCCGYGQPYRRASRPILAVRRHGERAGSSKRKPHPSRVSPSPTQCPACHADRFGRRGVAAVWSQRADLQLAPCHVRTQGVAAILRSRGRRGRFYVRRFLRIGSTKPLLPPKMTMEMGVHRVHGSSDRPPVTTTPWGR